MRLPDRDERGAFLIMWALLLLGLLTMVAIVIDLGRVRDNRRQAQRTADLAAIASGQNMADGDVAAACQAAVAYIRVNSSLSALSGTCGTVFGSPYACNAAGAPVVMTATVGEFEVRVQNPVPDAEIEDPNYPVNPVTLTQTLDSDGKPCQRLRVTVLERNDALFAGVVGVDNLSARGSAVVRGFIGVNPTQNAGLVVLERLGCQAIVAGGASGQASVLVKGSFASDGTPRPGVIQVDTKALEAPAGNCTAGGGNPPSKFAVFGGPLVPNADRPGAPSVEAEAIGGKPGRLDMFALANDPGSTHTAYNVPTGVSPSPTAGVIASRNVVDSVFNADPPGPTVGRVTTLKNDSTTVLSSLEAAVLACPTCNRVTDSNGTTYQVYPPGTPAGPDPAGNPAIAMAVGSAAAACAPTGPATLIDIAPAVDRVYANCSPLNAPRFRFRGTTFVLRGRLNVGSNGMASFPNVTTMIVGGCGGCTPPSPDSGVNVDGALLVNSGPLTPLSSNCNDNIDNDVPPDGDTDHDGNGNPANIDTGCLNASDWDEQSCLENRLAGSTDPARFVIATGSFESSISAVIEMCQTFVLMADGAALPDLVTSGAGVDPTCAGYTDADGVFHPQPCPKNNAYKGNLSIFGTIDWAAPNQTSGERDTTQANQYFEDLAVWTETSAASELKGSGATITSGVFFFPNAPFQFTGQASQSIDLNAQFISRRLEVSGQGTLSMRPNPDDTVDTPAPFFALIR